jgi:hypothetical protein
MSADGTYTTAGHGSGAPLAGPVRARGARRPCKRIATHRLVHERSFAEPVGNPDAGTPVRLPRDVFQLRQPFADREVGKGCWVLTLDSWHPVSAPTVITRGILNAHSAHS